MSRVRSSCGCLCVPLLGCPMCLCQGATGHRAPRAGSEEGGHEAPHPSGERGDGTRGPCGRFSFLLFRGCLRSKMGGFIFFWSSLESNVKKTSCFWLGEAPQLSGPESELLCLVVGKKLNDDLLVVEVSLVENGFHWFTLV